MSRYWIWFVLMWITGWIMAYHEAAFARYTLPKGIRVILFSFTRSKLVKNKLIRYKYTLHNIVYESLLWVVTIVTHIVYLLSDCDDIVLHISLLFLIGVWLIYIVITSYYRIKYWAANREPKDEHIIYPFYIYKEMIRELLEVLGLQTGQQLNNAKAVEFSIDNEKSLAAEKILFGLFDHIGRDVLLEGSKNDEVKGLQYFLAIKETGVYDEPTKLAVCELQKKLNITVDGVYNPLIVDAIIKLVNTSHSERQ